MQGFSGFLDLKIWGQFSGLKKFEFSFPDLKFEVDTLKKLKEKIKKVSKFWNCPKTFPSVQTCFGAIFLKMFFLPSVPWSHRKYLKKSTTFQNCRNAQNLCQNCPTCFEHVLWQFSRLKFCPVFHGGSGFSKVFKIIKKFSKFQNWPKSFSKVSKRVLNMLWGDFSEFFCRVFHAGLFRFSGLKKVRSGS